MFLRKAHAFSEFGGGLQPMDAHIRQSVNGLDGRADGGECVHIGRVENNQRHTFRSLIHLLQLSTRRLHQLRGRSQTVDRVIYKSLQRLCVRLPIIANSH